MIVYLLKSIACLLLLLLVHRVLLQREVLHRFNRFFLLFSVVGSFLIPLYTIEVPQEIVTDPTEVISEPVYFEAASQDSNLEQVFTAVPESQFNWEYLLLGLYGLISLVFFFRFARNIKVLVNKIQRNIKINYRGQTLVLLKEESLPFSFLKYIFVAESDLENGKFTDAVFAHERTHIEQKHSWDILFIEALMVPLWFHPGLYWAKATIKLNHEFIADEVALRSTPLEKYESQLLSMMLSEQKYGLASSLNFSLTKKRFEMMKRKSKNLNNWIKVIALVPVLGALVYFFSERVAAQVDSEIIGEVYVNASNDEEVDFDLTFELKPNGVYKSKDEVYTIEEVKDLIEKTKPVKNNLTINLITNPKASMGQLSDFQAMLRDLDIRRIYYYGSDHQENKNGEVAEKRVENQDQLPKFSAELIEKVEKHYRNASFFVVHESGELLEKTYQMLSDQEKKILVLPPPPTKKSIPTVEQFESWKNPETFALWLNGTVISNDKLNQMKSNDIVYYYSGAARSNKNLKEHQVYLYNQKGFDKYYGGESGFTDPLTKEDTLYLNLSKNEISRRNAWVKNDKNPVAEQKEETADKWPPGVKAAQVKNDLESYIDAYAAYEKLRKQAPHFVNRSKAEQEKLTEMYSELRSMYFQVAFHDKPKVRRAVVPYVPYLKLTSKGEVYYKKGKDLTAEELSIVGPPPPPPTPAELLESYKKVSYQYELMRNKGRNDASLSMEERNTLFLMYNELQITFLNMGAPERRQVKMVNFPYYRVEENGKNVFKAVSELTPEQRALNNC
ncbi:M56 family metallopeptidase [Algoriphagus yeomjeoni]|uniref:M56 family metallopeptidase n=1 Tax=Algoriphagus yeomjeoni TaxID=291403 RepID=UPI003CE45E70